MKESDAKKIKELEHQLQLIGDSDFRASVTLCEEISLIYLDNDDEKGYWEWRVRLLEYSESSYVDTPEHPYLIGIYEMFCECYTNLGRYDEALEVANKRISLIDRIGAENYDTAMAYFALGYLLFKKEQYLDSISYTLLAIELFEESFNTDEYWVELDESYELAYRNYEMLGCDDERVEYYSKHKKMKALEPQE